MMADKKEFIEELKKLDKDEAVSLSYLVKETSARDRQEAKEILREIFRDGMLKTTPGFEYRLLEEFREE